MRLIILGGPGAGKGTQAQKLCQQLNIPLIGTGDILRQAIIAQTELGQQAQPFVEKGELVPDPTMIEFIRARLLLADAAAGWLLDGYPRTAFQAEELDFLLDDLGQRLNWAIWLEVPEPVLMSRSLARKRPDDQPEIVQRRIDLFYQCTIPIMEYYERRNRLLKINATQPLEKVQQELLEKLHS
ncbi:adenylate kinase [Ancylothrix sp. C2]|uniref:adenylate kinase n=1 Tax=Ancylothrix sp. D3o TaxID=2953691 RepID=UPI0021BB2285|nr:adenylate kinase [Ancylothrix sp. D3o]MCT7952038.1 adenylate kinase [Ancylothrix sp. D3o]